MDAAGARRLRRMRRIFLLACDWADDWGAVALED